MWQYNSTYQLKNTTFTLMGLLLIVGSLIGCGGTKTTMSTKPNEPSGFYKVVQIGQSVLSENNPTLNFDLVQYRISGNAGCNDYSGTLLITEDQANTFSVDSLMTTKMYCSDDVMAVEYKFLKYLGQSLYWSHAGDTLSLFTQNRIEPIIAIKSQNQ